MNPQLAKKNLSYKIVELDRSYLEQIIKLEPEIYEHGWSPNLIESEFDNELSVRFGIFVDNNLVGYSFSYIVADELHILNIGIVKDFRGCGLGSILLDYVLDYSHEKKCHNGFLEVRRGNNKAIQLYKKHGFVITGTRSRYYSNNGEDAFLMNINIKKPHNFDVN